LTDRNSGAGIVRGESILKDYIEERAIEIANYIIESKATVREAAKVFKVSKSTVHKDVSERLPKINPNISEEVKKVLNQNKAERHIRGGRATRIKYKSSSLTE
jgi:putative DeoR family transcriptional regulator (stage III sporulation protein D)